MKNKQITPEILKMYLGLHAKNAMPNILYFDIATQTVVQPCYVENTYWDWHYHTDKPYNSKLKVIYAM